MAARVRAICCASYLHISRCYLTSCDGLLAARGVAREAADLVVEPQVPARTTGHRSLVVAGVRPIRRESRAVVELIVRVAAAVLVDIGELRNNTALQGQASE